MANFGRERVLIWTQFGLYLKNQTELRAGQLTGYAPGCPPACVKIWLKSVQ